MIREPGPGLEQEGPVVADVVAGRQPLVVVGLAQYDTKDAVVLKLELPEVDVGAVQIRAENNVLSISGERKLSEEAKEESYFRIERIYGPFVRTFTLPMNVDATEISAKYKDGILRLFLPKKEETKPRQVTIEVEKA